jgi:hypothetical protein
MFGETQLLGSISLSMGSEWQLLKAFTRLYMPFKQKFKALHPRQSTTFFGLMLFALTNWISRRKQPKCGE